MSTPAKTASTGGVVSSEGVSHEVVSMEHPIAVPKELRLPRLKPMPTRVIPKPKKDKQKKLMPVPESLRKHAATQPQRNENPTT